MAKKTAPSRARKSRAARLPDSAVITWLASLIRKSPKACRTGKNTLLEIADLLLARNIGQTRPLKLRAHMVFAMFLKHVKRAKVNAAGSCHEWQGDTRNGVPVLTTVNSISGKRMVVDARKYILENPGRGKRRNFRTIPENVCKNPRCVNPRHLTLVRKNPLSHVGENHPRSKYSDKLLRKLALQYNAGATAKQLAKKYGMSLPYVEQVMRKQRRTDATAGLTMRARFGTR